MKDWKDGGEEWSKPWGNSAAQSHDRVHVGRATRRREQARSGARYVAATRNRRKIQGKIDKEESEKLVRYQRLLKKAEDVFGDATCVREWLTHKQTGLGGAVPLDFAKSEIGAREVENLLGRIEYGVYS